MKAFRKNLVAGLAVIGMGVTPYIVQAQQVQQAQQPPAQEQGTAKPDRAARMQERIAKRQAALHDKLKLTPQQEPAWNAFIASARPEPRMARPDRAKWKDMTVPQRMESRLEMLKQAETGMTQRLEAVKRFYGVLTPEQQKVFNENYASGPGMRHKHGHGHDRHHQGPRQGQNQGQNSQK